MTSRDRVKTLWGVSSCQSHVRTDTDKGALQITPTQEQYLSGLSAVSRQPLKDLALELTPCSHAVNGEACNPERLPDRAAERLTRCTRNA